MTFDNDNNEFENESTQPVSTQPVVSKDFDEDEEDDPWTPSTSKFDEE